MKPSHLYFGLASVLFFNLSQAKHEIDASCNGYEIDDPFIEAMIIAKYASKALGDNKIRDASDKGLWRALFEDGDRAYVKGIYDKISNIDTDPNWTIRFFCGEDTSIHWPSGKDQATDKTANFYHSGFKDKSGQPVNQDIGSADTSLPRKTLCQAGYGAYTINGIGAETSNQVSIVLCSSILNPDGSVDRRQMRAILEKGLQPQFNSLGKIYTLSLVILHELCHSTPVGGINPVTKESIILDGPGGGWYGFSKCKDLRKQPGEAVKNADSYTTLASGLFLQFPDKNKHFSWVTGAIDLSNGWRPYIPPRQARRGISVGSYPVVLESKSSEVYAPLVEIGWKPWAA